MELHRLDQLLSAHYENAVGGDITSTHTRLRVLDQRAKLLGLYPEQGKMQVLIAAPQIEGGGAVPVQIEFVVPTGKEPEPRWEAPPGPRLLLPAPRDMRQDQWGTWVEDNSKEICGETFDMQETQENQGFPLGKSKQRAGYFSQRPAHGQ